MRQNIQTPIAPEILKIVSGRINTNDKGDHLLLPPESDEAMPYVRGRGFGTLTS
jgi:hypothetical protein